MSLVQDPAQLQRPLGWNRDISTDPEERGHLRSYIALQLASAGIAPPDEQTSADAMAASDVVSLIAIERQAVLRVLRNSPDMVFAVIEELCRRVRNASDMFGVKSEKQARLRLARTLLRLSAKWGEPIGTPEEGRLLRGFSQSELGDFAGLARENVNRYLKAFEDEGLILRQDIGIVLLDLEEIAETAQL